MDSPRFATAVALISLCASAWLGYLQYQTSRDAQRHAQQSLAPALFVEGIQFSGNVDGGRRVVGVSLVVKNAGQTAATALVRTTGCGATPALATSAAVRAPGETQLGAGMEVASAGCFPAYEVMKDRLRTGMPYFIDAMVEYEDLYGEDYVLHECYGFTVRPRASGGTEELVDSNISPCVAWICTDEICAPRRPDAVKSLGSVAAARR